MRLSTWVLCFLLTLQHNCIIPANGLSNFRVKGFHLCNSKIDYSLKFYATFRTVGNEQYCDGNATFKVALDDDLKWNFTAELLVGKTYVHLFNLEGRRTCTDFHRYFGEFAYDMERHAQLVPGLCPVPPGRHHIHNYQLNFNKLTFQNFPFGRMRLTEIITNSSNEIVTCLVAIVENQP